MISCRNAARRAIETGFFMIMLCLISESMVKDSLSRAVKKQTGVSLLASWNSL